MSACPRCDGPVGETTAVCPHCDLYLLEWDPKRGRLGTAPPEARPGRPPGSPAQRPGLFGVHGRPPVIDTHTSLTVLRALCGVGMALHGLLVLARLVEPTLALLAWIAVWLPVDAFWRSTRRGG